MQTTPPTDPRHPMARRTDPPALDAMRSPEFRPRRSVWPGLLVAGLIAAGITAVVVSAYYDDRSLGTRVDATVAAAGSRVSEGVQVVAQGSAEVADRAVDAVGDAAITAAVKTALAADPTLSAVKIDVTTQGGAVLLEGPAPDERSRERAAVLAAAPKGVARVDNNLVVAPSPTTAVKPGTPP